MSTFAARIEQQNIFVYDLRVTIADRQRYFIVKIKPTMKHAFLRAVEADSGYTLEDFGEVLYRGIGEPDYQLKAELRERFGMYA